MQKKNFKSTQDIFFKMKKFHVFHKKHEENILLLKWNKILGFNFSKMCYPLYIKKSTLYVGVKDSMWSYQITNKYAATIIDKVNKKLQNQKIDNINCIISPEMFCQNG